MVVHPKHASHAAQEIPSTWIGKEMGVIILAAGQGTKMWPFGLTHPKAALPVGARPLIHHTLDTLGEMGFHEIIIVAGHLESELRQAVFDYDTLASSVATHSIQWVTDVANRGTAHSLSLALQHITNQPKRKWLVLYGDVLLFKEDVHRLVRAAMEEGVDGAALLAPVGDERPQNWICADERDGRIVGTTAHPRGGRDRLAGAFVFGPDIARISAETGELSHRVSVGVMAASDADLSTTIQNAITRQMKVAAVHAEKPTIDLDKPWHIHAANEVMVAERAGTLKENYIPDDAYVDPAARIDGFVHLGSGARIEGPVVIKGNLIVGDRSRLHNGAIFQGDAIIGKDTRIGNYCLVESGSVVGDRCVIDHAAEFGGVLMNQVYLYHYMEISGVIGRSVDIGAGTLCGTLRFDDDVTTHRVKGRPEKPPFAGNASYIGDFCRLGVGVILMPGTKIGPYSLVGPGVVLGDDLPENTRVFVKQEHIMKPWGPERYGW